MNKETDKLDNIFSSPIWISQISNHKNLNSKMHKFIKDMQKADPAGLTKSNLKGWHSNDFDLDAEEPRLFVNSISSSLNQVFIDMGWDTENQEVKITSMWSIINKKNSTNARHIHSNNYISAAYYVKAPDKCGDIVFHDPRSAAVFRHPKISTPNKLNSNVFTIEPKDGCLVLFPSYLHHSVDSNRSDDERIVISFNIDLRIK